ncbi:hypothetical protein [Microbacterium sp. 77mftsu3.1]|uniref:hypothetical protein n=1 Tax=Microbacterium sp. 77mftsu3.1 TaxID=1761802 RepID=UPI000369596E|nr:hypothetical protein [Microbacterium sp. 77mftsu3.1]SDH41495.1 hypothetical protein SAMN04488590_3282 [Microbacterium sp. 77mftsu3.1]
MNVAPIAEHLIDGVIYALVDGQSLGRLLTIHRQDGAVNSEIAITTNTTALGTVVLTHGRLRTHEVDAVTDAVAEFNADPMRGWKALLVAAANADERELVALLHLENELRDQVRVIRAAAAVL